MSKAAAAVPKTLVETLRQRQQRDLLAKLPKVAPEVPEKKKK